MRRLLTLALVFAFTGCGSTEPEPDLSGKWTGIIVTDFGAETWTYTITDNGGRLSGSVSIVFQQGGSVSGSLSGNYDHPGASISTPLTIDNVRVTCEYNATVSDSQKSMSGTCNCNDGTIVIVSAALALQKQE